MEDKIVKVRTTCTISENSVIYPSGSVFETTLTRAEALGDSVSILLGDLGDEDKKPKGKKGGKK